MNFMNTYCHVSLKFACYIYLSVIPYSKIGLPCVLYAHVRPQRKHCVHWRAAERTWYFNANLECVCRGSWRLCFLQDKAKNFTDDAAAEKHEQWGQLRQSKELCLWVPHEIKRLMRLTRRTALQLTYLLWLKNTFSIVIIYDWIDKSALEPLNSNFKTKINQSWQKLNTSNDWT